MPMLYDRYAFSPTALLSFYEFPLPLHGRRVLFTLPPGPQYRLYTLIDGELTSFQNGGTVDSPRRLPGHVFSLPHSCQLLVIRCGVSSLPEQTLQLNPIPLRFPSGEYAALQLRCSLQATLAIRSPDLLAEACTQAVLTDPEAAALDALRIAAQEPLVSLSGTHFRGALQEALSSVDALARTLCSAVEVRLRSLLPWAQLTLTQCRLSVENSEALLQAANRPFTFLLETRRKLVDALLQVYGTAAVPSEVTEILKHYLPSNPGIAADELISVCQKLKELCDRSSPQRLLAAFQDLKQLPVLKGV